MMRARFVEQITTGPAPLLVGLAFGVTVFAAVKQLPAGTAVLVSMFAMTGHAIYAALLVRRWNVCAIIVFTAGSMLGPVIAGNTLP